ncbi:DEAD/DEAH box helicase [Candidatus Dojkabacteria bacterium]|uniref:DEAD/DEAH box helicase n=1 Tax=Candidatus Dojkabacteria bacterium TaxID=2099670 RepID=A0A955L2J7_9BACT|nr:DEAD/DEAH box helicase [Candidatus Dojkabacteria bacterium]MCB0513608.1 DEAD/DEAH box helicase [Bacteroidota bacterium]
MSELVIVRGDLKNKPVSSTLLADYFESVKSQYEGTLFIGYPIIGTSDGGYQIDALLITKQKGLIIINIEEGSNFNEKYIEIQDENFTKLSSKLLQHKDLTKKRKLAVDINTFTYAPACKNLIKEINEDYPYINDNNLLDEYLNKIIWNDNSYFNKLLSVLQSVTTIRRNKSREFTKKADSKGSALKKLEDSIVNLDRQQSLAVIETVEGVQRIRGLAGSGKTIILALKVAYLHAKNKEWKIAVTFNSRALKEHLKKYITIFSYENSNEEPNWNKIDIIHAWGTSETGGIYYNLCKDQNIEYIDVNGAKAITHEYGKEFEVVCEKALREISDFIPKYDLLVIDEAQDFSKEFLRICYHITKSPKRLVYAYDELQNLNKKQMESPEVIFGNDSNGNPLVNLRNINGKPKEDITLDVCYRNSLEVLTTAHALGFGIYHDKLVQMFNDSSLWLDIGYNVIDGKLEDGENVTLKRNSKSSPEFLSNHSPVEDLISFNTFNDNEEQIEYIVSQIEKNIKEDELDPDDIMVINPNPLTTKSVVGIFRQKLYAKGLNSSLAGVSTSPDVFFQADNITFTGIYRAKGNEASMVYIMNAHFCYDGLELANKRNILFTAITRSKAWVRVCGFGQEMLGLENEFNKVKENNFSLKFKYPTEPERRHMNIVNRDMTIEEKNRIRKNKSNLGELLEDLKLGRIQKEDLPQDLIEEIKNIINL